MDGAPCEVDPRHVLESVVSRLRQDGLYPVVALELEFYLLDASSAETGEPTPPVLPETEDDRALMAELKRRDPALQFVDFEAYLDEYLAALAEKSKEQVAADLASFRGYYFDHNDDPGRLSRLEAYAGK